MNTDEYIKRMWEYELEYNAWLRANLDKQLTKVEVHDNKLKELKSIWNVSNQQSLTYPFL